MCSAWFKCLLKKEEKINMRLYITIAPLWLLPSILWCSTQLPSLPMLPRILSPIVPLYWLCLQSNNYDQDLFISCAAAFCVVTQCSSLVLDQLSSAVNEQQAFFSQSQRQHSRGNRGKEKATLMSPSACNKSFGNPKTLIGQNNFPKFCH